MWPGRRSWGPCASRLALRLSEARINEALCPRRARTDGDRSLELLDHWTCRLPLLGPRGLRVRATEYSVRARRAGDRGRTLLGFAMTTSGHWESADPRNLADIIAMSALGADQRGVTSGAAALPLVCRHRPARRGLRGRGGCMAAAARRAYRASHCRTGSAD